MLRVKWPYLAINISWLVVTLLVFFILIRLGLWQQQRADEKKQRLARIEHLMAEKAIPVTNITDLVPSLTLNSTSRVTDNINDFPVEVSGELDTSWLFLLDNQMLNGQFGYRVFQWVDLTPKQNLTTEVLEASLLVKSQKVLVNLGWHLADRTRRTQPNIQPLSGYVNVVGHVRIIEQGITLASEPLLLNDETLNNQTKTMLIQRIDLVNLSELIDTDLLPFVVYVDEKETLGYQKNWQPIVMSPEKHEGYAFQWFSLAAAWLMLMIFAARKALHNNNTELTNQNVYK